MRKTFPVILMCFFSAVIYSSCTNDKAAVVPPACDTATVRLSVELNEILSNSCFTCHSGGSPAAGIDLQNYNTIKSLGTNGVLLSAINHTGNVTPMPLNGTKLSDCEINKFTAWVNRGTLDN